jgi:hypothetical protein
MDQGSRVTCAKAYRLGFKIAKAVWHQGESVQRLAFIEQAKAHAAELDLPHDDFAAELAQLKAASDAKALISNARFGIEMRNGMDSAILLKHGEKAAAAFRVGFGIASIGPQFEFLSMSLDACRPFQEMYGSITSQLENLIEGAGAIGIQEKSISMLKKINADARKADASRMLLMMAGSAFDRELGEI